MKVINSFAIASTNQATRLYSLFACIRIYLRFMRGLLLLICRSSVLVTVPMTGAML